MTNPQHWALGKQTIRKSKNRQTGRAGGRERRKGEEGKSRGMKEDDDDDDGGGRMAEKNAKQKEKQVEIFPCQTCACGFRSQ